jgi:FecR protein
MRVLFLAAAGVEVTMSVLHAEQPAQITEAVNKVEHGSKEALTTPATKGTEVYNGEYVKTLEQSRAELLLPTTSITRLGANTIFNYSEDTNTIDLQSGTVLFYKPKDAAQLNIRTAAVTAAVLGTTGFIGVQGDGKKKVYRLGVIEGHVRAVVNGQVFRLGTGDILQIGPDGRPVQFAYDIPKFVQSSPLLNKFQSTLPSEPYIQTAVQNYKKDEKRGFVGSPLQQPQFWGEMPIGVALSQYDAPHQAQPGATPQPPPPKIARFGC